MRPIHSLGFQSCASECNIYFSAQRQVFLAVYVDDILVFGKDKASCDVGYSERSQHFYMEYLDPPTTFLGLNIIRPSMSTIFINQSWYVDRMLIRFNMLNSQPPKSPLNPSLPLIKATSNDKRADATEYQEITGSLNHLAVFSRPNIAFAAGKPCSFNSNPTVTHMKAGRHVFRYLCT
jgi:Reverse transcriptase (RNA-dependent DNA polymerase)